MGLWERLAFIAPFNSGSSAGGHTMFDANGSPHGSLTAGSTLQWRGTPYGLGVGISGASNLLYQDNFAPITSSNGTYTGDVSAVCLANPIAEARSSILLSQGPTGGSLNIAANPADVSGRLRVNIGLTGPNVNGVIDGKYHLFGGVRAGTVNTTYLDGIAVATQTAAGESIGGALAGLALGNSAEATTNRIDTACNIVFAAAWNRALTAAEMWLLARDPFIMFRPIARQKIYYIPAAGGADVRKKIISAYTRIAA